MDSSLITIICDGESRPLVDCAIYDIHFILNLPDITPITYNVITQSFVEFCILRLSCAEI